MFINDNKINSIYNQANKICGLQHITFTQLIFFGLELIVGIVK